LLQFKRGAFAGGLAVKPCVLRFSYGTMSPSYDVTPFLPLVVMNLCLNCDIKVELLELPLFVPNDYLYRNHADKVDTKLHNGHSPEPKLVDHGSDPNSQLPRQPLKWEIYAWAVREVMSQASGFIKNDQPYREKLHYEELLGFKKQKKDKKPKNGETQQQ
jgi:hypothetical protein